VCFLFGLFLGLGVLDFRILLDVRNLIRFGLVVRIRGSRTLAWVVRVPAMSCGFASFGLPAVGLLPLDLALQGIALICLSIESLNYEELMNGSKWSGIVIIKMQRRKRIYIWVNPCAMGWRHLSEQRNSQDREREVYHARGGTMECLDCEDYTPLLTPFF
jgi:hypothetical protein